MLWLSPLFRHRLLALLALFLLLLLALLPRWGAATAQRPFTAITFSHPSGRYDHAISLRLQTAVPNATIWYTQDGTTPTPQTAVRYTHPLRLTANPTTILTLQARAQLPDGTLEPTQTAVYFIGLDATIPIVALQTEPANLWDAQNGLFTHPKERGSGWERPVWLSYVDENGRLAFQLPAGIRIHGLSSRAYDKKSLRLYFRPEYGPARLDYPIFPQSAVTQFKRLVLHAGGQDFPAQRPNGTLLRNALMSRLAHQIGSYAPHSRPVLLFLNGQRWGIYQLRERIDDDYLLDNFGVVPHAGDDAHWDHLQGYIVAHDLADPAHYAYVQTQIDLDNFIDMNILQLYGANNDWPQNNDSRFRDSGANGRWRWLFWDTDFAFGLAPSSRADTDMVAWLFDSDDPSVANGARLQRALLANPDFRHRFATRADELLNGPLHPDSVLPLLDQLTVELAPNIQHETERWPGSSQWEASVAEMREFVQKRPFFLRQQLATHFP